MDSQLINDQWILSEDSQSLSAEASVMRAHEQAEQESVFFQSHFHGYMEMYSDAQTVAEYLDAHEGWFCRCAEPMTVEPLGNNGYTLTLGQFRSLGYEVEPRMSVVLQPSHDGVYHMYTIPVPGYTPPGYDVDYRASLKLNEMSIKSAAPEINGAFQQRGIKLPSTITKVTWQLSLGVSVRFPKFIYRLPMSLIQKTGDRLLTQIVRQISPRMTAKVQNDFHTRLELPVPPKSARGLEKLVKPIHN